jgi:hypothetical protein
LSISDKDPKIIKINKNEVLLMAEFKANKIIDLETIGTKVRKWFLDKNWTVKVHKENNMYGIEAQKKDKLRITFGACRALTFICWHEKGKTRLTIKQGSWAENIASNLGWFFLTGGANLAITAWSFVVQKQFEQFVKTEFPEFRKID